MSIFVQSVNQYDQKNYWYLKTIGFKLLLAVRLLIIIERQIQPYTEFLLWHLIPGRLIACVPFNEADEHSTPELYTW